MNDRIFAWVILWLSIGTSNSLAAVCSTQVVPCDIGAPGDFDSDGDIDEDDFDFFVSCATRANVPINIPACQAADLDGDSDADQSDFGIWQLAYTGPCECGPYLKEPPQTPPASPVADEFPSRPTNPMYSAHPFSGEFYQEVEDLRVKGRGRPELAWARRYRSRTGPNTTMGNGWDFTYNIRIEKVGTYIRLHDGNGRSDIYTLQPNGTWTRVDFARVLSKNPDDSYTLTFSDTSTWDFSPIDSAAAAGKITKIQDRNGNFLTFTYDAQGRLIAIHDSIDPPTHDRVLTIAYNADDLIASVTDFTGRSVTYAYYQSGDSGGSAGDLKSVTTPTVVGTPNGNDFIDGKTTFYTYSKDFTDETQNHNLLTITNPMGQIYLTNIYGTDVDTSQTLQFDRLIQQVWGDPGDRIKIVYKTQTPTAGNHFAVVKAIVNDRVGNVSEYLYDTLNRRVIVREYTGRADPDLPTDLDQNINPPIAPLRSTDPPFFATVTTYNESGIESNYSYPRRIDYPNGNAVEYTYELALNPTAPQRSRRNLREVRHLPGPLGGAQSQIVDQYEYHPTTNLLTSHTDPRLNETLHTYDSAGNRIHTQHPITSVVEDWEYNAYGQVTAHIWPDNGSNHRRRDEYTYYTTGTQKGYLHEEIVDAPGLALTTTYEPDSLGRNIRTINPQGNDTVYAFNSLGRVVRRTSPEVTTGGGVHYQRDTFYDANDNIIRVELSDTSGTAIPHITTYDYDILNFTTAITVEQALTQTTVLQYTYDANRNRTLTRYGEAINGNQPANTLTVQYDERDKKYREVRGSSIPENSTTQYDYDPNGNVLRVETIEIAHEGLEYIYDGYNRPITRTDAMGNVHTYTYDPSGNLDSDILDGAFTADGPGSIDNVRLRELTYTYDAMNRRITQTDEFFDPDTQSPIGDGEVVTEFEYTDNSQLNIVANDNEANWQFTYDTANRRSVITDPKANTTSYSYDPNGNVVSVTEVDKSDLVGNPDSVIITSYTYDNLDRRIRRVDNATNIISYEYDARDNLTLEIDARNTEKRYTYDLLNRPLQSIVDMNSTGASAADPSDIVNSQTWDASSRLLARTDDNGNTTQYTYDALNRLIALQSADSTSLTMSYNARDKVVAMTDANGTSVAYTHDLLDRRTGKTITPAAGVVGTTSETYVYDGASRLLSATDDDSEVTRQYDSLSHTTRETQRVVPAGPTEIITAEYDGLGNRTRLVYPGGRDLACTFDSLNRVLQISDNPPGPGSTLATYQYLGPYRVEQCDFGNGTRLAVGYDDLRRATNTHHTVITSSANIDNRSYGFDPNDNRMQMQSAGALPADVRFYQYDAADRMTQSQNPPTGTNVIYGLDGVGNRMTVSGGPDAGNYVRDALLPEPSDYQVNQYTSVNGPPNPNQGRTYDRNGNLKTSHNGQRLYSYDYQNQLVEFTDTAAGLTIIYRYDCLGRRIEQNSGGVLTRFYYEGTQNIEEQNQSNITVATYVNVPAGWCDPDGDTQPIVSMTRSGQKYFYHGDDLGSPVRVTNASAQVVEQYQYNDFGKPLFYNGLGNPLPGTIVGNPFLFRGNRYDTGTGFIYAQARAVEAYAVDKHGNWNFGGESRSINTGNNINWNFGGSAYIDANIGRTITRHQLDESGNGLTYNGNNPMSETNKRDYCVQYRETDFNFVSRLMEEEGIYYFFKHMANGGKLEIYDYPGEYAQRFDGIGRGGSVRSTPKPRLHSSQSAIVTGPPEETISTDKYGRVKVQFHWDREGKKDTNDSCWVRVSQPTVSSAGSDATLPLVLHLTPSAIMLPGEIDPNDPSGDGNNPTDPVNLDREVPLASGSTTTKSSGGCGVTGFEAVPFMLLWLRAFKRRSRQKN